MTYSFLHHIFTCLQSIQEEQLLLTMSKNQPKHPQLMRTLTKRFTVTFPGTGGTVDVPFPLVPRVHSLPTTSKSFTRLLLQNKIKKSYTGIIKSKLHCSNLEVLGRMGFITVKFARYFSCPKGINVPEGKMWHLFIRRPSVRTARWLIQNWFVAGCVESLPPPHSVTIARHLICITDPRLSDIGS